MPRVWFWGLGWRGAKQEKYTNLRSYHSLVRLSCLAVRNWFESLKGCLQDVFPEPVVGLIDEQVDYYKMGTTSSEQAAQRTNSDEIHFVFVLDSA